MLKSRRLAFRPSSRPMLGLKPADSVARAGNRTALKRHWLTLTVALLCGPIPVVAEGLAPKEIATARQVYVAKCAKCHKFYEPKAYNEADWRRWSELMSRKSKLKPDQADLLWRYLDEYRAGRIVKAR